MNKSELKNHKYTFSAYIILIFFSLIVLMFLAISLYGNKKNSDVMVRIGTEITNRVKNITSKVISKTLMEVQNFCTIGAQSYNLEKDVSPDNLPLVGIMRELIRNNPILSVVYTGTKDGRFLQLKKVADDEYYRGDAGKKLPHGSAFAIRFFESAGPNSKEQWRYEGLSRQILGSEELKTSNFDYKNQDWYKSVYENKSLHWSDIYVFPSLRKPGITVSNPAFNDANGDFIGVYAFDIELHDLSKMLFDYKPTKNSRIFVVNNKSEVIAHSDASETVKIKNGKACLSLVSELKDQVCNAALSNPLKGKDQISVFKYDGKEYIVSFSDFPRVNVLEYFGLAARADEFGLEVKADEYNKDWKLVIILPEDDILLDIKKTQFNILQIILGLLVISLLLVNLLAKRISRHIVALSEESKKIMDFDLSSTLEVKSAIKEISFLNEAIVSMRHSMQAFSKFIPKTLVGKLMKNNHEIKVGGKNQRVTFLFTDIAGFTTVCENYPPEKLSVHISEYFEEVTKIIFKHNGTVDKYIGDSVMAFFGAPNKDKDHTLNACRAAIGIQKRLSELNQQWLVQDKPVFDTRIGVHVGFAIVGNIGSSDRINYTALGDNVNLASRLEGINKFYKTNVIISEDVYKEVRDHCLLRPLDIIAVKGKNIVTPIYELKGIYHSDPNLLPSKLQISFCTKFAKAFQLYQEKRWDESLDALHSMQKEFGDNYSVSLYVERCEAFKKDPPPDDWDGSVKFNVK